jgi:hypothetical protein
MRWPNFLRPGLRALAAGVALVAILAGGWAAWSGYEDRQSRAFHANTEWVLMRDAARADDSGRTARAGELRTWAAWHHREKLKYQP